MIPPQTLTWTVDVEPYRATSWLGDKFTTDGETWRYDSHVTDNDAWVTITHQAHGVGVIASCHLGTWHSVDELAADPDAHPPAWLLAALRAIEEAGA